MRCKSIQKKVTDVEQKGKETGLAVQAIANDTKKNEMIEFKSMQTQRRLRGVQEQEDEDI